MFKKSKYPGLSLIAIVVLINSAYLFAGETEGDAKSDNIWERSTLTGNWGGIRSSLEEFGIVLEAVYKLEAWKVSSGDVGHGTALVDNVDIVITFDLEKVLGLAGGSVVFYGLGNNGDDPNAYVGSAHGITNIAAPQAWKVYNLFYEQVFFDGDLSLLIGTYDYNSEFDVKETSRFFLNPSHGIGTEIAQSGENGPSIFPTASFGFRFKAKPFGDTYIMGVILDGIPGNLNTPKGTHIILKKEDGILAGFEAGVETEPAGSEPYTKLGAGFWYYTDNYDHLASNFTNWGAYFLFDRVIFTEGRGLEQGLSLFGRIGIASDEYNDMDYYIAGGLVYKGLISGRDDDLFGLAFASGHNTYMYMQDHPALDIFEHNIECSYRLQISPAVAFQPNIQYIMSPAGREAYKNVLMIGNRIELAF